MLRTPRVVRVGPVGFFVRSEVRLLLVSATILFAELLIIRWIPANIRYVGFFPNFLLMSSFLGIGVGILLGRRLSGLPFSPFPLLLLAVVSLVANAQLNVQVTAPGELVFGIAVNAGAADVNFLVLPLVIVLTALLMASVALPLGPLLRSMPPLRAYALDVTGSLIGIASFAALSAAGTPPTIWFAVLAAGLLGLALGHRLSAWSAVGAAAMVAVLYFSIASPTLGMGDLWSPYYRITTYDNNGVEALYVNGIPHQLLWRYDDPRKEHVYEQPYLWFPDRTFDRVLIIGAGTGSDVAIALHHGAKHVDAVEIDPVIAAIGRRDHPNRPYDDPRVTVHIDDGRNFLRTSGESFDLVVFAFPDSLTLINASGNLRLESYLFTLQSFASVRDHLAPGGLFVMYNWYQQGWLIDRLGGMLSQAFGIPPLERTWAGDLAILGDGPAIAGPHASAASGDAVDAALGPAPPPATDDGPFLYLREPQIASYYLAALAMLLLFAGLLTTGAAVAGGTQVQRFSPHFFVLGGAFLLLETRSLATFGLLFGSTWLVNALVFFAILASVLVAILVTWRFPFRRRPILYAALFGSLAIAYFLPPDALLFDPPWLRYLVASVLAFAPIFFANLVFTHSFRDTRTADMSFASNLLGAMVGGALEYVSLLTGYRALLLVAGGLYALAMLLATRGRFLGDRELESHPREPVSGAAAPTTQASS
jgi:SAM-dependent methyltransferase